MTLLQATGHQQTSRSWGGLGQRLPRCLRALPCGQLTSGSGLKGRALVPRGSGLLPRSSQGLDKGPWGCTGHSPLKASSWGGVPWALERRGSPFLQGDISHPFPSPRKNLSSEGRTQNAGGALRADHQQKRGAREGWVSPGSTQGSQQPKRQAGAFESRRRGPRSPAGGLRARSPSPQGPAARGWRGWLSPARRGGPRGRRAAGSRLYTDLRQILVFPGPRPLPPPGRRRGVCLQPRNPAAEGC